MGRVGRALLWQEFVERLRDRWVLVVSLLFALLAFAVGAYGRQLGGAAESLTGPSLVTLASLFVPLVALMMSHDAIVGERERNTLGLLLSLPVGRLEVVLGKFLGRGLALVIAVVLGLAAARGVSSAEAGSALWRLTGPTLLLGLAFLSLGFLVSMLARRSTTATGLVVVVWFGFVLLYDLGILVLLVATEGALSPETVTALVLANPTGLYRMQMMTALSTSDALEAMGIAGTLPGTSVCALLWGAWIVLPLALSGLLLTRRRVV